MYVFSLKLEDQHLLNKPVHKWIKFTNISAYHLPTFSDYLISIFDENINFRLSIIM